MPSWILLSLLMAPPPFSEELFPVHLHRGLNNLQLQAKASSVDRMATVSLSSQEDKSVYCRVIFKNGPEIRERRVLLDPKQSTLVSYKVKHQVARLDVHAHCALGDYPVLTPSQDSAP